MPTSESQKRASKNWIENNRDKWNAIKRKAYERKKEDPEYYELCKKRSREHYWKNREKILEKQRIQYLERTGQFEDVVDVYHANCKPDDPITDSEDLLSTDSSIVSDVTDWTTATESTVAPPPPEPKKWIHPFFG